MGVAATTYHERTKHSPAGLRTSDHRLDFDNQPLPYKVYEGLPAIPLADAVRPTQLPALRAIAAPASSTGPARPDFGALTQLCWLSAGITKTVRRGSRELAFRAAACTGALYHVDVYLVAGALPDLDAGVYHFDPRTLSLDVLREGDYRGVLADAAGDEPAVARAPVTAVLTSTWWRNAWKYRERTYRHAFWDSGTILANLLAVAGALDLPARIVTGFADGAVADLLGVDTDREAPLELVPLGRGPAAPPASDVEPIAPETRPLSANERSYELIHAAYDASRLPDGAAARAWRERRPDGPIGTRDPDDASASYRAARRAADAVEPASLDPVSDAAAVKTPLHRTILRRGSCREYAREPLNRRRVATVLDRATRGVSMDVTASVPLTFSDTYLIVNDVDGVPSGAYHYHPTAGALEPLRRGNFRREAAHLALDQRLAGDAGLCVFFLTDLDAVTDQLGDRGYRAAQLEAAVTAGRLYLAAYAHRDLGATGLTFYDDAVTEFFAPRAAGQTPLFLWTLGRPA